MAKVEDVTSRLEAFEAEFPDHAESMARSCLRLIEEASTRMRRVRAAATKRSADCRFCRSSKAEGVN